MITNHIAKKDLESMRRSWRCDYLDYINIYTNLSNHWVDDVVSIENLNLRNYAYVLLNRNKIKRTTLEHYANLFLKMPLNLLKHISKKTNSKVDGIDIFFSIVDVIASDESMTTFKLLNSKHARTMQTDIFRLLFNLIDSSDIYWLKEGDFLSRYNYEDHINIININSIVDMSLPKFIKSKSDKMGHSFIQGIKNFFDAEKFFHNKLYYGYYDKIRINGKWYNYRNNHYKHLFVNINNELYSFSYKSDPDINISDVGIYEKPNIDIIEPEKLPGVKLEKTDGGFFDDMMIEVEVK